MWFSSWFETRRSTSAAKRMVRNRRPSTRSLEVETLEDRRLMTFLAPVNYAVQEWAQSVITADLNRDGRLDVVTANDITNSVNVLLGNGDGTFQTAHSFATDATPLSVAVGDFNRDGKLDLVTANNQASSVSVLLGNGDGTFQPMQNFAIGASPTSVAVGDLNGDGNLDLVVGATSDLGTVCDCQEYCTCDETGCTCDTYCFCQDIYQANVNVLLGNGDGAFAAPISTAIALANSEAIAVADFNADGMLDVVATTDARSATVLLGSGDGSFTSILDNTTGSAPGDVTVGDFNADGKLDFATADFGDWDMNVLLGNGDGTFQSAVSYPLGSWAEGVAAADFNADGKLDLVATDTAGLAVFQGNGDGTFQAGLRTDFYGSSPGSIVAGNFNNDGFADVAMGSFDQVAVLINSATSRNLQIDNVSVIEGDSGTVNAVFTVTLSNPSSNSVTVDFATADGTASAGRDYVAATGTLTFAPGETSKTITVAVNGDLRDEDNETFSVNLSNATNADLVLGSDRGIGTIVDNDPMPSVTINDQTTVEGNEGLKLLYFTVSLSAVSERWVTVDFATADGSATSGSDYESNAGTLTFAPGLTSLDITMFVKSDRVAEPNETFFINLSSPTNAVITDGHGVGTIVDDDEPRISISISDVSKKEGKKNQTTQFTFTVTLSAAYDQAVTMSFRTVDGTATTSDQDYLAKTGTLTFAPGETTKTITIVVNGDSKKETDETFFVDLFGNSSNSLFTKSRGIGTILNDD